MVLLLVIPAAQNPLRFYLSAVQDLVFLHVIWVQVILLLTQMTQGQYNSPQDLELGHKFVLVKLVIPAAQNQCL